MLYVIQKETSRCSDSILNPVYKRLLLLLAGQLSREQSLNSDAWAEPNRGARYNCFHLQWLHPQ